MPQPLVSVIIPVRDNPSGIREVLRCLSRQSVPADRFEVLVTDDGSRDDPVHGPYPDLNLSVIRGGPLTSYAARNRGIAAATGDVFAFCDSDCRPAEDWLERGLEAIGRCDLVGGRIVLKPSGQANLWSLLGADAYLNQRRAVRLGVAVTANLFVARRVVDRVGGFDESLPSGGDWEFVRRATADGAVLEYAQDVVVTHPTLNTARQVLAKVWQVNRWAEARRARAGVVWPRDRRSLLIALMPPVGMVFDRRSSFRPIAALDLESLECVDPPPVHRLVAIVMMYALVAPTVRLAQIRGRLTRTPPARHPTFSRAGEEPQTAWVGLA